MADTDTHPFIAAFADRARARQACLALPEATDPRVLAAARALATEGLARPMLLGDPAAIRAAAMDAAIDLEGLLLIDPTGDDRAEAFAADIHARRPKVSAEQAAKMVADPLVFAAAMTSAGDADLTVAGAVRTTAHVIRAGLYAIGLAEGVSLASSWFLVLPQGRDPVIFADCGLNIDPDAEGLAAIAIATAATAEKVFGRTPQVAMLSCSTLGSASHARIDKVREATEIVQANAPDIAIEGELQGDAALNPAIAARKGAQGGKADVLIFPDLDSGNIAYKLMQELGGAQCVGPFLQGFARPICDLSRGATVEDIVAAAVITSAIS